MEAILGSILLFVKVHYGDVSISILTIGVLTFYYKRVKPFLDSLPNLNIMEENKRHIDNKSDEIIENISSIKVIIDDLRDNIKEIENNTDATSKNFHLRMDGLIKDLNQISSKIETMMFLSIKGEIK